MDEEHQQHREFVDRGPIDPSVLKLHEKHRSSYIWKGETVSQITARRGDSKVPTQLDNRIVSRLVDTGFYGVYRLGTMKYDWGLINALIERWHQETHSFHLPIGEATITLQDIGVLTGLPVDGVAVTGLDPTRKPQQWRELCQEILGVSPPDSEMSGGFLKIMWLMDQFSTPLPEDATQAEVDRYTRAYIFSVIGGTVMPDRSGNKVKMIFLPLLRDIDRIRDYSWGSASLAFLYRELCGATLPNVQQIGGYLTVLQV